MQNIAKKHAVKANLLGDEDVNFENKIEDFKVKNEDNINISTANSYSHAITIVQKH